jgi:hypothetical protein
LQLHQGRHVVRANPCRRWREGLIASLLLRMHITAGAARRVLFAWLHAVIASAAKQSSAAVHPDRQHRGAQRLDCFAALAMTRGMNDGGA